VGRVAVDSSKFAANASAGQNRTYEGLRELAARMIEEAIETDRREDELYGEKRGDELPAELADPRTRGARIKELLEQAQREREQVEAERAELIAEHEEHVQRTGKRKSGRPAKAQPSVEQQQLLAKKYNLTDPDSGIVRHRGMLMQGYNVHATVADGQVILATRVSGVSPDGGQLEPMIDAAERTLSRLGHADRLEQVLADTGYWNGAQITRLKDRGLRVLSPPHPKARRGSEVAAMRDMLAEPDGRRDYQRRQQIVEPVFAHIKHIRGITRVLRRGKAAVQAEIDLIATTHNLLKLHSALQTP
jgi:hypothetical protein